MEFYLTTSIITVDQRYMPEMIPDYYYRKRGRIMGFTKKTWKNRIAEYINRRLITMEDGSASLVTVARDEGTISQEGDAFNAANMNDLEDRIESEFNEINQSLTEINNNILMINLPQSDFTWSESYVWRKPYTIPTGYTLEAIEVYSTNGDATLSGVYRFIDGKMCICVTGTYLDSTKWTVKPISNSYNFICNLKLRKNN